MTDAEAETEANRFAMELLIPIDFIRKDLEGLTWDLADGDTLKHLAKRYGVSQTLMALRLAGLGYKFY